MRGRYFILAPALLFTAAGASAQSSEPNRDSWTVSTTKWGCAAERLTSGDDPATVVLGRSYRGNPDGYAYIRFERSRSARKGPLNVTVAGEEVVIAQGDAYFNGNKQNPATVFHAAFNDYGKERLLRGLPEGAELRFDVKKGTVWTIPADQFTTKGADLSACLAEVGEKLLNARPEGETDNSPARGPVSRFSITKWISWRDYQSRWRYSGTEGEVRFTLSISRYGFVEECRITASSGNERMDKRTCQLVKRRARFYPARDSAGGAVAGTWEGGVQWVIADDAT